MKILLFGMTGQLGWELQRSLAPLGDLHALGSGNNGGAGCDFRDVGQVERAVRQVAPNVIVNAAAYTDVDRAESEPDVARQVNATAPGVLAQEAARLGALLVHYSSDYVFDGSGDTPWREGDLAGPLNVYGATKKEGEELVAQRCPLHLIVRTSWLYGRRGGNFARTILRLACERDSLRVVNDQVGAPTGADLVADLTAHMVRGTLANASLVGTYHAAAAGETTWNAYARLVLREGAKAGVALKATEDRVEPVSTEHFHAAATRPRNSRLDTTRLRDAFGLVLPDWRPGVVRMLHEALDKEP